MKLSVFSRILILLLLTATSLVSRAAAFINEEPAVAIFDFSEKGRGFNVQGSGEKVATMLYAYLSAMPGMVLVDREELDRIENELLLNMSGMVNPSQAVQVGQLTGAKILITGTLFEIDRNMMIVAKVIGVETSRVIGVHVQGRAGGEVMDLVAQLADKISETIDRNTSRLVAPQLSQRDRMEDMAKQLPISINPVFL